MTQDEILQLMSEAQALDIEQYDYIARKLWGESTEQTRRLARALAFGALYGGGAKTLSKTRDESSPLKKYSPDRVKELMEKFRDRFPFIGAFHVPARQDGVDILAKGSYVSDPEYAKKSPWYDDQPRDDRRDAEFYSQYVCQWYEPTPAPEPVTETYPVMSGYGPPNYKTFQRHQPFRKRAYLPHKDHTRAYLPHKDHTGRRAGLVKYKVRVLQDGNDYVDYDILATRSLDARCMAFVLDGGCETGMSDWDDGHVELAIQYTELVEMETGQ